MKIQLLTVLVLPLALPVATQAVAEEASLAECQRLKDRVEHYTVKRRGGGSNSQMRTWKRARQQSQAQFNHHRCKRYRYQLK